MIWRLITNIKFVSRNSQISRFQESFYGFCQIKDFCLLCSIGFFLTRFPFSQSRSMRVFIFSQLFMWVALLCSLLCLLHCTVENSQSGCRHDRRRNSSKDPPGTPVAVVISQAKDFSRSTIDSLTAK